MTKQLMNLGFIREHDGWSKSFFKDSGKSVKIELCEDLDSDMLDIYLCNFTGNCHVGRTKKITDISRITKAVELLK